MQIALYRCGYNPDLHGSTQIDHLAHGLQTNKAEAHVNGGIAVKGLKSSAPFTGQSCCEIGSTGNRIETFNGFAFNLQWNCQLNRIEWELWIALKRHLTADREIHGKQEGHEGQGMMAAR